MSQPPAEEIFSKMSLSNFNVDAKEFVPFSKMNPATLSNECSSERSYGREEDKVSPEMGSDFDQQELLESPADIAESWMEAEVAAEDNNNSSLQEAVSSEKPKREIIKRDITAKKEPVNVVFCGHVDAGKSTIGGQLMYLTGMVDKRTLEKYEKEARERNRESWYLSWALDINEEERSRGKTVEVGRAYFETEKKHFIILDAPGHKCFVPNMIGGASQADIAILVISARKGEFETGFEKGGQTREHAMLVKTAGVKYLVVLVNKMDDPTVKWSKERFDEIKDRLTPYLKKCGFQPSKDIYFIPCSGLTGAFLKDRSFTDVCPWYTDLSLIEYLDGLPTINRTTESPFRMPIVDRYKDMGTIVIGKVESGIVRLADKLVMMPNKSKVEVLNIYVENTETDCAMCGENIRLKLKGLEEDEISPGAVLCSPEDLCHVGSIFDAQVVILDYKSIICPGYNAVMHLHTGVYEIQLKNIICLIDKKTGEKLPHKPRFIKQDNIAILRLQIQNTVACMETFKKFSRMGRFTIRDEAKTVAVGKILKIVE